MSKQKTNVTCAIDNKGRTILKVINKGRVTSDCLIQAYDSNDLLPSDSKVNGKISITFSMVGICILAPWAAATKGAIASGAYILILLGIIEE